MEEILKHSFVSHFTRFSFVLLLVAAPLFGKSTEDRGSLKFTTTVGKAFAVSLTKHTGYQGGYSIIKGAGWLELTEEGILFGTPTTAELGDNEVFVAVTKGGTEYLYHIIVTVGNVVTPAAKYSFKWKAETVFKTDLKAHSNLKGTYTFTGQPKWLSCLDTGVLVGMPKTADVGTSLITVVVTDEKGATQQFKVSIEITGASETSTSSSQTILVGQKVNWHISQLTKMTGEHVAYLPKWLTLTPNGYILGSPTKADVGTHVIQIRVYQGSSVVVFNVPLKVVEAI